MAGRAVGGDDKTIIMMIIPLQLGLWSCHIATLRANSLVMADRCLIKFGTHALRFVAC